MNVDESLFTWLLMHTHIYECCEFIQQERGITVSAFLNIRGIRIMIEVLELNNIISKISNNKAED